MSDQRNALVSAIANGAGYLVPMLLNFVTVPILISHLGEEAFGIQALVAAIISYLMLADVGLDIPIVKFTAEFKALKKKTELKELISTSFLLYLAIGSVMGLLLYLSSDYLANEVFELNDNLIDDAKVVFNLTAIGFIALMINMWGQSYLKGIHDYALANSINIITGIIGAVLGLVLVFMGYGIVYFVAARILSFFIASLCFLISVSKRSGFFPGSSGFSTEMFDVIKGHLGFGFILRMTGAVSTKLDQILLGSWVSVAVSGTYAVPALISTSLSALLGNIIHFAFPMASELRSLGKEEELQKLFVQISKFVVPFSIFAFTPFVFLAKPILTLWVGAEVAMSTSPILIIVAVASMLNVILTTTSVHFMVGIGKIKNFTIYTILRAAVIALAMMILIPRYGMLGAAYSLVLALPFDLGFYIHTLRSHLMVSVVDNLKKIYLPPLLLSGVLSVGLWYAQPYVESWLILIAVCAIFTFAYMAVLYRSNYLEKEEKKMIQGLVNRLLKKN